MARLCERPGCSQPAEVMYGIDADRLMVWIEVFDGSAGYRAGVLCRRHADAMVVPLGWMLDDRREPVPRLFKTRDVVTAPAPRQRRHRSTSRDDTGQLELPDTDTLDDTLDDTLHDTLDDTLDDTDAVAHASAEAGEETDAEASEPWKPVFDQRDDLDGLLTARSPLLSRAFGKRSSDERPEPNDRR